MKRKYVYKEGCSKRKAWAIRRNWLIKRVRGALSVFSTKDREFMRELMNEEDYGLINRVATGIAIIDEKISQSKWKE